jgi:hypothetical protein
MITCDDIMNIRLLTKRWLLWLGLILPGMAMANGDTTQFPLGCEPLTQYFKDQTLLLPAAKDQTRLVLIQSMTDHMVWLVNTPVDDKKVTQWTSALCKKRWSALILKDEALNIACVEAKPGSEQYVACRAVVTACMYPKLKSKQTLPAAGWLVENKTFLDILTAIFQQAIEIPGVTPAQLLREGEKNV